MIEAKYGLKFSFPHTIVHINDNSDHTIEPVTMVAEDPSLYSTIVVTGAPMGEDNKIVNITNSDILTTAYGMYSLTASDIKKYGQSVEYANSLVAQGAPVKMLRITPPDSTYALSTILIQWRKDVDQQKFIVRFKEVDPEDYENKYAIYLSRYKNPARLNKAVCAIYNNPNIYSEEGWETRVFMTNISAGRGKDYNNMVTFINRTQQPRRAGDTRYEFGTIDTRSNALVESFIASLINDSSVFRRWTSGNDPIDTVNINVAKRQEGSSIIIPFVNEDAIRQVYDEYINFIETLKRDTHSAYYTSADYKGLYDAIFEKLNINTFDVVYGKYIYDTGRDDVELNLPMYQVDMFDMDIPKLSTTDQIRINKFDNGIQGYFSAKNITDVIPSSPINDWPAWYIENLVIDKLNTEKNMTGVSDETSAVSLGDVYLTVPKYSNPYLNIVTEINQYTGNVTTKSIPKVFQKAANSTERTSTSVAIKSAYNSDTIIGTNSGADRLARVVDLVSSYVVSDQLETGDCIAITGVHPETNKMTFILYRVDIDNGNLTVSEYAPNIFYYMDYTSYYAGVDAIDNVMVRESTITTDRGVSTSTSPAFTRMGTLYVNDTIASPVTIKYVESIGYCRKTTGEGETPDPTLYEDPKLVSIHADPESEASTGRCTRLCVGDVSSLASTVHGSNLIGKEFDVLIYDDTIEGTDPPRANPHDGDDPSAPNAVQPTWIYRAVVTSVTGSSYRVKLSSVDIPNNYYSSNYGVSLYSEAGGTRIYKGSTGFFDDNVDSIEFKWSYSALLTKAFRGQIDPRILSPVRVPAKYLFDAAYNTVVGLTTIPTIDPDIKDVIIASTIFTDEECEDMQNNPQLIKNITAYEDIDVKQAMYDLMVERNYQRIPEDKRPIGPGSGMSLHLDGCFVDINGFKQLNYSFQKRFDNPNASWDIGGYTDANTGVTYTWTKRIVDNLIRHCKTYTVNKPYVNQYTAMPKSAYTSIFPDVDATDWDLRELMYQSGGNSWVADTNGVVTRRSQRTLKRDSVTSDLLQENNMRTLSQLIYLLQNKLDTYLLEYDDDGVLQTMSDECNVMFNGWVGSRVQSLSIRFERDKNIDGRDIVVCYVDVTFRGLVLSIPIIVNVNRRTES